MHLFRPVEIEIFRDSVAAMVAALDEAAFLSLDPPDVEPEDMGIAGSTRTGSRGRPKIEISLDFLKNALDISTITSVARVLNCHPRTVRRRALDQKLVQPGVPVFQKVLQRDGTYATYRYFSGPPLSSITDDELDAMVHGILETFPQFGRRMTLGCLRSQGLKVTAARVVASYGRVHGAPGRFGDRRVHRRVYTVPGPNSLWHHDGQHGMLFSMYCIDL